MKPWHLYVTNGLTKTEELEFDDRIHYLVHINQVDDLRMCICGHEFASFSCNVQLSFENFMYVCTRLRRFTVPAEFRVSPFPVYAANWEDGRQRIVIGKDGFTVVDIRKHIDALQEAWEALWLDTHNA